MSVWTGAVVKLAVDLGVWSLVGQHVPASYMDEPFHEGQTQQYCLGNYHTWDPKITTFPGLYILGTLWAKVLSALEPLTGQITEPCGVQALRLLNVILAAACIPVVYIILQQQSNTIGPATQPAAQQPATKQQPTTSQHTQPQSSTSISVWALALCCMPLHWFYTHLYYTDVGATLFLLLCYQQAHRGRYLAAGLVGAVAVLFRQTNAVWVAFTLGTVLLRIGSGTVGHGVRDRHSAAGPGQAQTKSAGTRQATPGSRARKGDKGPGGQGVFAEVQQVVRGLWQSRVTVLQTWPLVLVPLVFVAFLVVNKGVAVGDREAHQPVRHAAQLVYFSLFSAALLAPLLLSQLPEALRRVGRAPLTSVAGIVLSVAVCVAALRTAPAPHPYLLADNRHYTFYVWRKLLARGGAVWQQGAVGTAAGVAAVILTQRLTTQVTSLWVLGFLVCLAAVLVPAWLLEFRYFTAGFLLLALHLPRPSLPVALLTLMMYLAVDAATLYLFLHKPFKWADDSIARFMW